MEITDFISTVSEIESDMFSITRGYYGDKQILLENVSFLVYKVPQAISIESSTEIEEGTFTLGKHSSPACKSFAIYGNIVYFEQGPRKTIWFLKNEICLYSQNVIWGGASFVLVKDQETRTLYDERGHAKDLSHHKKTYNLRLLTKCHLAFLAVHPDDAEYQLIYSTLSGGLIYLKEAKNVKNIEVVSDRMIRVSELNDETNEFEDIYMLADGTIVPKIE